MSEQEFLPYAKSNVLEEYLDFDLTIIDFRPSSQ